MVNLTELLLKLTKESYYLLYEKAEPSFHYSEEDYNRWSKHIDKLEGIIKDFSFNNTEEE